MTRYRTVHMSWRSYEYWVQRRAWWWWEDVKDFADKDAAVAYAKARSTEPFVIYDSATREETKP